MAKAKNPTQKTDPPKKRGRPKKTYPHVALADARKVHQRRSKRSLTMDRKSTSKVVTDTRWSQDPSHYDYPGLDTQKMKVADKHQITKSVNQRRESIKTKKVLKKASEPKKSLREKLLALGGNSWSPKGSNQERIYFNLDQKKDLYGLETDYSRNKVGYLNGERISNNSTHRIVQDLDSMKFWYDTSDNKFHSKAGNIGNNADYYAEVLEEKIRQKIKE